MEVLSDGVGTHITICGKRYLLFAGNNYLGLANHPALKDSVISYIQKYGLSFSASRRTTGTCELHLELERLLSAFKHTEDSVIFASGYMGNSILLHALQDDVSAVFLDRFSHPSIVDGVPRSISNVYPYRHCDAAHLEHLLKTKGQDRPLIITDGIFGVTGEIAPLDQIYPIAQKYHGIVVVDDAHATGILGEHGRGTPEHFGLDHEEDIYQTDTMSKALSAYGGFIASSQSIIDTIRTSSSMYIGQTALPPPVVASAIASIRYLTRHPELRCRVLDNAIYLKRQVLAMGFSTTTDPIPIIPFFFESPDRAKEFSHFLYEHHIVAPHVEYPVRTNRSIVRMTVSAAHTSEHINTLLGVLRTWRKEHGFHAD